MINESPVSFVLLSIQKIFCRLGRNKSEGVSKFRILIHPRHIFKSCLEVIVEAEVKAGGAEV